jgi:hypothetical protein
MADSHEQTNSEREKCEQMCKTKLKKISKVQYNFLQTVLIRNTLKYVQNSEYVTFACDDDLDYEPLYKRQYTDSSSDDIKYILCEMTSLPPLMLPI